MPCHIPGLVMFRNSSKEKEEHCTHLVFSVHRITCTSNTLHVGLPIHYHFLSKQFSNINRKVVFRTCVCANGGDGQLKVKRTSVENLKILCDDSQNAGLMVAWM